MQGSISSFRRLFIVAALLAAVLCFAVTAVAYQPDDDSLIIRVGCNPSQNYMFRIREDGYTSGYGYEYLQQLSYYGGWEYEYVYASFAEQMEMLRRGEIDLMVNVSYTEERAKEIDYSAAPMGEEIYCLCVKPGSELTVSDLSTFSGKKLGAVKDSYQLQLLRDWVAENQVDCRIYETNSVEDEAAMDAIVIMNMYSMGDWMPLLEIGESDYYFGISKKAPGLTGRINNAQRALLEVRPYYAQELQAKYFGTTMLNRELSPEEKSWAQQNPVIRMGYYSHYHGEHAAPDSMVQLLDDVVEQMSSFLTKNGMQIEMREFHSAQQMEQALLAGEIHMMFPAYGDLWMAEQRGYMLSAGLYSPGMLIFSRDTADFRTMYDVIAVVREDPVQYPYVKENYPDARLQPCGSILECIQAVKQGRAGCTIINSQVAEGLLYSNSGLRGLSFFTALSNAPPEVTFGIAPGEPELLSMINKEIHTLPEDLYQSSVNEYLLGQSESALQAHVEKIMLGVFLAAALLSFFVWRYIRRIRAQTENLKRTNEAVIDMLGVVVEYRSQESGAHIRRVKLLTRVLAEYYMKHFPEYGLTEKDVDVIVAASALHDIGKVAIPDSILLKPGRLTSEEFSEMKTHTTKGSQLLVSIEKSWDSEYKSVGYDICRYHHERYDGKGYPSGLTGDEIPVAAQIVSIVDVYDAMTHKRCYKPSFSSEQTLAMIENGECGTFSPKLLEALRASRDEMERIIKSSAEENPA